LGEKGVDAGNIEYVEGMKGKRTMYLCPKPTVTVSEQPKLDKQIIKNPKDQIDAYRKAPLDPSKKK
jgi:hypothetical protein